MRLSRRRLFGSLMVVALGTVVAGCGQKGGLYIPDDKREKSKKKALNLKPKQRARGLV